MSTELAVRTPMSLAPRSINEAKDFAQLVSNSTMLQPALRGKPADVFAILLTGMELGLGPMQALRSISIIQGRPTPNAELLVALAKQNPQCIYFRLVESSVDKAVYQTHRQGSPEPESLTYTMDDAKRAGLTGKDNWRGNPAAMLRARASAALARAVYPDSVLGLLAREEVGEEPVGGEALDVEYDASPVDLPPDEPAGPVEPPPTMPFDASTARTVEFPVVDENNDEREAMLKAERAEKEANAKELHDAVNRVYPGDKSKALRKDVYKRFGLAAANPIKQYLGLPLDRQNMILEDAKEWCARVMSDLPVDFGSTKKEGE